MRKKNTIRLSIMMILMLVVAFFGYLIIRETLSVGRLNAEINSIKALIGNQQTLLAKMREADKGYERLEARLSELQRMIPERPMQDQVLAMLQQCADDASVKLDTAVFDEHAQEKGYVRMPVRLNFSGSYKGFLKLLSNLMYAERLVKINDVRLSGSNGTLSIELTAETFYKTP